MVGAFVNCVVFVAVARGRDVWLTTIEVVVQVVQNGAEYRTYVQSETVLQSSSKSVAFCNDTPRSYWRSSLVPVGLHVDRHSVPRIVFGCHNV